MKAREGGDRRRVLVVEDDLALRDFLAMALEDIDAEIVLASSVAEAGTALDAAACSVVLTDLCLGDGAADALLDRLLPPRAPALARVVVFSGGVDGGVEAELLARGVWRVIRKPAPVAVLAACVQDALAHGRPAAVAAQAAPALPASAATHPAAPHAADAIGRSPRIVSAESAIDALVDLWFAGERSLYDKFLQASGPRFAQAVVDGDAAVDAGDDARLVSLCHQLKTQLTMLGATSDARLAIAIENSMAVDRMGAAALWQALRRRLLARTHAAS